MKVISRQTLKDNFLTSLSEGNPLIVSPYDAVELTGKHISGMGKGAQEAMFKTMSRAAPISRPEYDNIKLTGRILNGFDFPFGEQGSVNSQLRRAHFASGASGNTLLDGWENFIDALRLDLTIRKMANETIRQYIYDVLPTPGATRTMTLQELFPYAFEFTENNGEGQAVSQGEKRGGQYDAMTFKIYATGFTWTLLQELFDFTHDLNRMNDGLALSYAAKRDDLAIKPILDATYGSAGTAKHTAAHIDSDLKRQQLLHQTILDAIDALSLRKDPVTKRLIPTNNLTILASSYDANHIAQIINGLPENMWNQSLQGIPNVARVVAYDDEVIEFENRTVTYTGVTAGTIYIIAPNRYMKLPVKRGLTVEFDATPDVKTLAREERAWYFCESIFNDGIGSFIQKVTLPSW